MNIEINKKISKELLAKLNVAKDTFVPARTSTLPQGKVDEILTTIKKNYDLQTIEEAITIIAILFQQGGTARGCDGNMSISIFDQTIKLADIRKILKQHSCNKSERKLARSLATEIFEIAHVMEIPGNLNTKIQKTNLEATYSLEEKVWMSDFQSENPDCPVRIRTLILESFKKKETNKKKQSKINK
jgi:hypothetical protein